MSLLPRSVLSRVVVGIFHSQWMRVCLVCVCSAILGATFILAPIFKRRVHAGRLNVEDVARRYPNFTAEQRLAVLREIQSQLHPRGRDLTFEELIAKFARFFTSTNNGLAPAANFTGNLTTVAVSNGDLFALNQQANCSLNLDDAAYTVNLSVPTFGYTLANSTPHYELVLHNAAGLTTSAGNYASSCGNTNAGISSRKIVFPGTTTGNVRVYAGHFYNSLVGRDQIFVSTAQTNDTFQATTSLNDPNNVVDLATSDLNGDGNGDLIAIEDSTTTGANSIATVFLGKPDGSFSSPTQVTLAGTSATSAVVDDFNGDGKKDVVISTFDSTSGGGVTLYVNFLAGNGDGTFKPVQTYTETPPANVPQVLGSAYYGLISADLRGSGHKDLVTSAGIVLFGNGDGTFTQSATLAFPPVSASSEWGPNVVAADFNKDGKVDLAVDNGATIQIFSGKGDGTFALKSAYSAIGNVGYLVAQDIDGDGNVDLWTGDGNNGSLGSDQFDYNLGYALMGNGDGTFHGAPSQQFAYTGNNLGSLRGGGSIDAVGVNSNGTFTSYLGDGKGNFTAGPSLVYSPITLSGTQYTVGLDSYALGDIDGDGFADLVYLGTNFYGPNYAPGLFVATGKGDGSFNAPVFVPTPPFVQAPDIDVNPVLSGIHLADMNHDGKLDVVYTYSTYSYNLHTYYFGVAVQMGNGDGTFQSTSTLTQLYSGASAPNPGAYQIGLIGNVNNDVNSDLLILSGLSGNSQNFTLQVYLGTGTGGFSAPKTVTGITPGGIYQGYAPLLLEDMNNDGTPDLVALQPDSATGNLQIAMALGNGDGTFKAPNLTTYASQFIFDTGLAVADFDGDGKLDVATLSYLGPSGSGIALGKGDGTLQTGGSSSNVTPAQTFFVGEGSATIALDLNGDGKPDILNGNVVLINQGASSTGTLITPSVTVAPSASSITTAQALMVTVTVNGGTGNPTPTGSVTLSSGAYTSSATALSSGAATITIAAGALATGTDTLAAVYTPDAGSSTAYASASGSVSVTVTTAANPDFALSNGGNITVSPGATTGNTSTIMVTPSGGFTGTVDLTCVTVGPTGATDPATCGLSPTFVNVMSASPENATVTAFTTAPTSAAMLPPRIRGGRWYATGGAALACLLLLGIPARRRGWRAMLGVFVLLVLLAGGVVSCTSGAKKGGGGGGGGNPGTTAGTYTITVTGVSGSTTHTTVVTVTVN
jgi:hypothetical protein